MSGALIDSNILIDVFDVKSTWHSWSLNTLKNLRSSHVFFIIKDAPKNAAFLASKTYLEYRKNDAI